MKNQRKKETRIKSSGKKKKPERQEEKVSSDEVKSAGFPKDADFRKNLGCGG
ncbi:MAG: hypothetical protein RIM99_00365 [Cyclobacteriaceae bacterium]